MLAVIVIVLIHSTMNGVFMIYKIMLPIFILLNPMYAMAGTSVATFAGGCFWCMEHPFDEVDGVLSTTSGYIGGFKENPTYHEVSAGRTGHTEAVKIEFDSKKVSYSKLLDIYWHNSDPTTANRQFCDVGSQYRPGIFYQNEEQQRLAEASKSALQKNKPFQAAVVTEITQAGIFWPAEGYHQDYYLKNPIRYRLYRYNCGRDQRLEQLWGEKNN